MNIFGRVHLGYVVIDTKKFAAWRRFGRDAIGMHLDETLPDVMRFRLDDHECRFLVRRGPGGRSNFDSDQELAAAAVRAIEPVVGAEHVRASVHVDYDLSTSDPGELGNLSVRGSAETGDNVLFDGLILQGGVPKRVLFRAR